MSSVSELRVVDENNNIFNTDAKYIIPRYQRSYAWEDKQLIQLVEDIEDVAENAKYYIGSLVVSKQEDNQYEVVDGQQRLTSLYLLLNCLGIKTNPTLTFACRQKSNYTLRNIEELLVENRGKFDVDRLEPSILRGLNILQHKVNQTNFDKKSFIEKIRKVIIYRIEVPKNTDLNRYFEIMNTRGEQLEQYDILKATLMRNLDADEQELFAKIWDACSDMTGYVQMHFASKNNAVRESIFGSKWNSVPENSWQTYKQEYKKVTNTPSQKTDKQDDETYESNESQNFTIRNLIDENFIVDDEGYNDDDSRVRFESIIDFPHFLLHTLKVYIALHKVTHKEAESKIVDDLLDDKKLLSAFHKVIESGVWRTDEKIAYIKENKANFARTFIICLLRTRFLFDKYIIKREFANDSTDGEWSLKSLWVYGQQSRKKAYYSNTKFTKDGKRAKTNDMQTKANIMIQSALRVSYTSPKIMHWITKLLIWLSENDCDHLKNHGIEKFNETTEKIAIDAVKENFFDVCKDGNYAMGVNTPHIVFNYLDYLLWCDAKTQYDDFAFEFRNSVEHWYPQNPSEGTFEPWKDGVDRFGNLCIVQRNINSKFSNMSPEAKKSTFGNMVAKGSIKLRIMSELTEKNNDKFASLYWKDTACKKHEGDMIDLLKRACKIK